MGAMRDNVTNNNPAECILDTLKPGDVFLSDDKKQIVGVV